jgi:hypothetical protein
MLRHPERSAAKSKDPEAEYTRLRSMALSNHKLYVRQALLDLDSDKSSAI